MTEPTGIPQTENGYTRIANELLEEILRFDFSKRELLIVLALIRKTYGFNKTADRISGSQLARMTGLERSHAVQTLNGLVSRGVVLKQPHTGYNILGMNKKYTQWTRVAGSAKTAPVPKQPQGSAETATKGSAKTAHTKDNLKDTIKRQGETLPAWLSEEDWQAWKQHRKEIKKTLTASTEKAQIRKLEKYLADGHQPADVIEHSIAGGYTGLFPENQNGKARTNGSAASSERHISAAERVERAIAQRDADAEANGFIVDADGWTVRE